jgi:hypothetical protein
MQLTRFIFIFIVTLPLARCSLKSQGYKDAVYFQATLASYVIPLVEEELSKGVLCDSLRLRPWFAKLNVALDSLGWVEKIHIGSINSGPHCERTIYYDTSSYRGNNFGRLVGDGYVCEISEKYWQDLTVYELKEGSSMYSEAKYIVSSDNFNFLGKVKKVTDGGYYISINMYIPRNNKAWFDRLNSFDWKGIFGYELKNKPKLHNRSDYYMDYPDGTEVRRE